MTGNKSGALLLTTFVLTLGVATIRLPLGLRFSHWLWHPSSIRYWEAQSPTRLLNQNATKHLLLHTGPLATFEAREVMVSALGLIGEETSKNLVVIRRIRNCFAHAMSDINFNSPEIVRACNRLKLADKWQFFVDQAQEKKTRYKFGYACHTIYHRLMHFIGIDFARGIPPQRTLPDSPILP